jgi:hypothetical protein
MVLLTSDHMLRWIGEVSLRLSWENRLVVGHGLGGALFRLLCGHPRFVRATPERSEVRVCPTLSAERAVDAAFLTNLAPPLAPQPGETNPTGSIEAQAHPHQPTRLRRPRRTPRHTARRISHTISPRFSPSRPHDLARHCSRRSLSSQTALRVVAPARRRTWCVDESRSAAGAGLKRSHTHPAGRVTLPSTGFTVDEQSSSPFGVSRMKTRWSGL